MKLATLCYVQENGCTLMLHRNTRPDDFHLDKWNGLGGKLQAGESPEEGVRREVFEESGLALRSLRMRGVITFPQFDGRDDWYVFVFTAERASGELRDSSEGHLEWIPDASLLDLNLWPGDRVFLPWIREESFFSAKFTYRNKEFIGHEVHFYA
ncbi:MAG: 8-oxo-dGTP diphosphatase [Bdellovibrionota bacterium]